MKRGAIVKRFLSALLLAATLLSAMHHHNDLKSHPECPVCILQTNISSGDVPSATNIQIAQTQPSLTLSELKIIKISNISSSHFARAPPTS